MRPTPCAQQVAWSGLTEVPAGLDDGDDDTTYTAGTGLSLEAGNVFSVAASYQLPQVCWNGQVAKWDGASWACGDDDGQDTLAGLSCGSGQVAKWNGSAWACGDDGGTSYAAGAGITITHNIISLTFGTAAGTAAEGNHAHDDRYWSASGNGGADPNTHFLGTTDNVSLTLKVSDTVALRIEPGAGGGTPNLAGGYSGNVISDTVQGGTIGGGGELDYVNRVTADYATIGGGQSNQATGSYATVGGGRANQASYTSAAIGGGSANRASGDSSTIGGGSNNQADAWGATVGGGIGNRATGATATVGGGSNNQATTDATVGGGSRNQAGYAATVGGGSDNLAGSYATVPGGQSNTAQGRYSFAAGLRAKANHNGAFVWGDSTYADVASTAPNQFVVRASGGISLTGPLTLSSGLLSTPGGVTLTVKMGDTVVWRVAPGAGGGTPNLVGGYSGNVISDTVQGGTIGGGGGELSGTPYPNRVTASFATLGGGLGNLATADYAAVGGGRNNRATGWAATVGGGVSNQAIDRSATVGGGEYNIASSFMATVGGGYSNMALHDYATVGGGIYNEATNEYATVPGGYSNSAQGMYSFAAGRRAKANHDGAFVWGDGTDAEVASTAPNQFVVRASGGITLYSSGDLSSGTALPSGSGSWATLSDRAAKANLEPVDGTAVLETVARLPISTWNYKSQAERVRHMGPMAQDFYAAFGLGESERYISSVDADGVALAAIQGLHTRIETLEADNAELRARLDALEAKVNGSPAQAQAPANWQTLAAWLGLGLAGGCVVWMKKR
ncbi:MAG: tail fiber domain-containing protein [Thermoflexales bacterium]|nr:tail fiber domain-containing protein [Thermoflexales bacterium]